MQREQRKKELLQKEKEAAELKNRLTLAQLEGLRRQLEPHFLSTTLNTISELVYANPKAAEEMIARLTALLRHAFAPDQEHETALGEEMRLLDLYLDMMRLRFAEPPAEMQISPEGHWSLGPERIGAWPWVAELCLAGGERRRRAVVRLEGERLISLVVVVEARPGVDETPSPPSWRLPAIRQAEGLLWRPAADLEVRAAAGSVELAWRQPAGETLRLRRAYSQYGLLLPLEQAAPL